MPLNTTNISSSAKERLKNISFGQYKSLGSLVGLLSSPEPTGTFYFPGKFQPLLKSWYHGDTPFDIKTNYFFELDKVLNTKPIGNRDYGVFSHANGEATDCCYAVVRNFLAFHRFAVLYKNPADTNVNGLTLTEYIRTRDETKYYYATTGSFHTTGRAVEGPIAVDGTIYTFPFVQNTQGTTVRFVKNTSTANTFEFNDTSAVTTGITDGFSTLIRLIKPPSGIVMRSGTSTGAKYYNDTGKSTKGVAILAYNRDLDILFSIIKRDGATVDLDPIADMLEILEFKEGVFCDGSDSVYLADYESPAYPRFFINHLGSSKDKPTGLKVAIAIQKTP